MTIRSAPYYWFICDQCGASSTDGSDYAAWADREQAVDQAEDSGWYVKGENALCDECGPYCAEADCLAQAAGDDDCCDEHTELVPPVEIAPYSVEFSVIIIQIVGKSGKWEKAYYSDLVRFRTRSAAIRHGIHVLGHDDFLVGQVDGRRLVRLSWMDEDRDDAEELAEAAYQLGLAVGAQ